jgi:hypothetical protein
MVPDKQLWDQGPHSILMWLPVWLPDHFRPRGQALELSEAHSFLNSWEALQD